MMRRRRRVIAAIKISRRSAKQIDRLMLDVVHQPRRRAAARVGHPVAVVPCRPLAVVVQPRVQVVLRREVGGGQLGHVGGQLGVVVVVAGPLRGRVRRVVRGPGHPPGVVVAPQQLVDGGRVREQGLLQLVAVRGRRVRGVRGARGRSAHAAAPRGSGHALHLRQLLVIGMVISWMFGRGFFFVWYLSIRGMKMEKFGFLLFF